jgi:hypothetical protein
MVVFMAAVNTVKRKSSDIFCLNLNVIIFNLRCGWAANREKNGSLSLSKCGH